VVYCYMNMVLHYPGAQTERRKRGAYPLDWNEIDFDAVYRKGVERMRKSSEFAKICADTEARIETYSKAAPVMRRFAERATKHREEARLLSVFADAKMLSTRVFSHLLREDANAGELARELKSLRAEMQKALKPFLEPDAMARMLRAWIDPEIAALE